MTTPDLVVAAITETREQFLALVTTIRPELHRYCARMTGSVFDGEDIVQDTLAKAYYALGEMATTPPLRPWLFRIAHNTAMDFLRRYEQRHVDVVAEVDMPNEQNDAPDPDDAKVEAALQLFSALPPLQRSALAWKDVIGLSLEEVAATMGISIAAVKAALVRARAHLATARTANAAAPAHADVARLRRYAERFNARDWDALRALFAAETELEVVSRYQRRGRAAMEYLTRVSEIAPQEALRAVVGFVDGALAIAMFRADAPTPTYFVRLQWRDEAIALLRDFRYVPYIADEATFTPIAD